MSDPLLRRIFVEALEQPSAEERARFLNAACASDTALRQQVELLLQAHDEAGAFLADPSKKTTTLPWAKPQPTEKPGDWIGRYKLLQQIGEGGCGVVYMAEQEEPVRRHVALKVIKLGMDTKQVIARFEAERQALAMMDHPNIAKVLDAGATETGRPYFVMELIRGTKITEFCNENKVSTQERLNLFIQVCQAIQHAHQKGIIHRDIKPSNILVTVNDGIPVPKVIDFGIAKATQGRLTDQTLFTAFEQFIGTPAYMSPEQAAMTTLDIDTRSDIYSLGVLLYELLTGRPPFDQKELLAVGLDEMRRVIREVEPVKPSTRLTQDRQKAQGQRSEHSPSTPSVANAFGVISQLSTDLDWIVMKCLEKDRGRRYETANGLAGDLQRHLNDEPVTARPPGGWYEFHKTVRRHRFGFAAGAALVLVLILGVIGSSWQAFRATKAERAQASSRREAEAEKRHAETEAAKSEQVSRFLKQLLSSADESVTSGRDTTVLRDILDKTAERVGTEFTNQPQVEAELREIIGHVYFQIGPMDKAEAMLRRVLDIREKLFGEESMATGASYHDLANVMWRQGQEPEAEVLFSRAVEVYTKLKGRDSGAALASRVNLGGILLGLGKVAEAEAVEREAIEALKTLGLDGKRAFALSFLGRSLARQNKFAEAESAFRESLAIQEKIADPDGRIRAQTLELLARTLQQAGRLDEAETVFRDALSIHRKLSNPERNSYLAWTLEGFGTLLSSQGRLEEAENAYRESLGIARAVLGDDKSGTVWIRDSFAKVLRREGKHAEAAGLLGEQKKATRKYEGR